MDFLDKVEVIKQYRQSVKNSETFDFFLFFNTKISEINYNDNGYSIRKKSRVVV